MLLGNRAQTFVQFHPQGQVIVWLGFWLLLTSTDGWVFFLLMAGSICSQKLDGYKQHGAGTRLCHDIKILRHLRAAYANQTVSAGYLAFQDLASNWQDKSCFFRTGCRLNSGETGK